MITKLAASLTLTAALFAPRWTVPQWTVPLHVPYVASGTPCTSLPFSDNFTRPDGPLGSPWALSAGASITIASHNVTVPDYSSGNEFAWPGGCPGWTSSQYAQATYVGSDSGSNSGLTVNTIDGNNSYYLDCAPGVCSLFSNISGSTSYIGTFTGGPTAGQVFCFELDTGATAKLKVAGTYDPSSFSVSGLTGGAGGGGVYFGSQTSPAATMTSFSTGNGTCP